MRLPPITLKFSTAALDAPEANFAITLASLRLVPSGSGHVRCQYSLVILTL